jgi:hypothetical protein
VFRDASAGLVVPSCELVVARVHSQVPSSGWYVDAVNGLVGAGFARAAPEPLHRARGRSRTDSAFIIRPFVAFPRGGGGRAPCCPRRAPNMVSPVSC